MADILQTTFPHAFSWMIHFIDRKIYLFWFGFQLTLLISLLTTEWFDAMLHQANRGTDDDMSIMMEDPWWHDAIVS